MTGIWPNDDPNYHEAVPQTGSFEVRYDDDMNRVRREIYRRQRTVIFRQPTHNATQRPYADPEKAARKLLEIASTIEPVKDGRIYIEMINGPFLFKEGGTPPTTRLALSSPLRAAGSGNAGPAPM